MSELQEPLLNLDRVKVYYPVRGGAIGSAKQFVKAVDDVSLSIGRRESVGLVGESGCGKSTIGKAIIQLESVTDGSIEFEGQNIAGLRREKLRDVRKKMQIVFQDPYSSLNPRKTVGSALKEILTVHQIVPKSEIKQELNRLIDLVGLSPEMLGRYPHEFSGGQRQRVSIAKALAVRPLFLICDEAISALDVSIQAQILSLLKELKSKLGLSYLFISHSLGAVKYISDKVAVMYLGKVVEYASTGALFANPRHPYTQALLNAFPSPDPDKPRNQALVLQGNVPSAVNVPSGCAFRTRCPFAQSLCASEAPRLVSSSDGGLAACHYEVKPSDWTNTGAFTPLPRVLSEDVPRYYSI